MRYAGLVLALLLAGCTRPAPTQAPPVVVTLGDSVPAGTACGCQPFPALYAHAQHAVDVNLAVPGDTSTDVRTELPTHRAELLRADEVLLMVGANDLAQAFDASTSFAAAAAAVRTNVGVTITAIERLRPVPVLVLGYWNVLQDGQVGEQAYGADGVRAAASATGYANDALRDAATAAGARYVSTTSAFHGVHGELDPTGLLADDGDHPNAAGHAAIAALLPPLTPRPAPSTTSGPG